MIIYSLGAKTPCRSEKKTTQCLFVSCFCYRVKINPSRQLHNSLVFGQRFTGPEAKAAGMVDSTVMPALVLQESLRLLAAWNGKNGFSRESLQNMKLDVYADAVKEVNVSKL